MSQILLKLEKLEEVEKTAKSTIQAIQQEIDESAKQMASQNAEYQKQKQALESGKKLALEKYLKESEEKYQKENADLEAKNWGRNANFVKEMTTLKERLKDKVNWSQVDMVMDKKLVLRRIANLIDNRWNLGKTKNSITISSDGLNATNNGNTNEWLSVFAEKGFAISVDSSGPIVFYFEVTNMSSNKSFIFVGLSSGNIPNGQNVGGAANSYAIRDGMDHWLLSGKHLAFEWPNGPIKPVWKGQGDVIGCGLLRNSGKEMSIFFTANGILMGKQIPINCTVDHIYPSVSLHPIVSVEANFGNDSAKPFRYDIEKCLGMVFK